MIPDYYRGKSKDPFTSPQEETVKFLIDESNWDGQLKADFEETVLPYVEKLGAKSIGTIGNNFFCSTRLQACHYPAPGASTIKLGGYIYVKIYREM